MNRNQLITLFVVAFCASAVTLLVDHLFFHTQAAQAQAVAGLEDYSFTPQHRKGDQTDETFFFFNRKTGEIWVYQKEKPKEHYQVVAIGEKLKKLN